MSREELIALMRALGDPNRYSIYELLLTGTYCNCELGERLNLPPNLISHHLRVLRETGLLKSLRHPHDARWVLYSLDKERMAQFQLEVAKLLDPDNVGDRMPDSGWQEGCACDESPKEDKAHCEGGSDEDVDHRR